MAPRCVERFCAPKRRTGSLMALRQELLPMASLKSLYADQVENKPEQQKKQSVPTASAVLDDGTIVEMVFQAGPTSDVFCDL